MAKETLTLCDHAKARGERKLADHTVTLSFGDHERKMDLSQEAFDAFVAATTPWRELGTKVRGDHGVVRVWGRINGHTVPKTGKTPDAVYVAYDAATPESREHAAGVYKTEQDAKKTNA